MRRTDRSVTILASTVILCVCALFATGSALIRPGFRHAPRTALENKFQAAPDPTACTKFSAIAHAVLPSSMRMAETDTWGGPLYGILGDQYINVNAALSGNDGEEAWYEDNTLGVGKGGLYTVCTDYPKCKDSFTYEVPFAVFPSPPGELMDYIAYGVKIVKGTGKFSKASGNLTVQGPAIAWPDDKSPIQWAGRWTAEIHGAVCGIQ